MGGARKSYAFIMPGDSSLNLDHFVLLTKIHRHRYWIHDPAIGVQIYSLQEISNAYTGVTLLVTPTEK